MAKNALELSIKIAGKIDGSFTAAVSKAQKETSTLAKAISGVGKAGLALEGAVLTGTITGLKKCTDYAKEWEVSMADVAKYVDGITTKTGDINMPEYKDMEKQLFKLSTQFALTPKELAAMASNLGQSGYSADDIAKMDANGNVTGVLRDTAVMASAFDIDTEQAGEWMAKWENAFGATHDEIMVLNDQINYLGNTSATTAAEIAEAVNKAGSLGGLSGVSTATTAALATTMLQAGGDAATVGTSLNRVFVNLMKGSSATKSQKSAWSELGLDAESVAKSMTANGGANSANVLYDVFSRIGAVDESRRAAIINSLFGSWAQGDVSRIVGNLPALQEALNKVQSPNLYTGSMEAEAKVKNNTTEASAIMRENAKLYMMNAIGEQILPAESKFNQAMMNIYTSIAENAPEIGTVANSFADVLISLTDVIAENLPKILPELQKALDWLAANPETALKGLGAITGIFSTMTAAPKIEKTWTTLFGDGKKGGIIGSAGNIMFSGSGILGKLANAGYALSGGATNASAYFGGGLSGSGAAALGASSAAGGIMGAIGVISGLIDIFRGTKSSGKDAKNKYFSGGTKIGMVGAGAATGAAIGSIIPGAGTLAGGLIGAGVGGTGALLAGSKIGKALSDATDPDGWITNLKPILTKFFFETLPEKWGSFWDGVGSFLTETVPYALGYATGKAQIFLFETLPQKWDEYWTNVKTFWSNAIDQASEFIRSIPEKLTSIIEAAKEFVMNDLKNLVSNIWNSIKGFIGSIPNMISNAWNGVKNTWGNIKSNFTAGYNAATGKGNNVTVPKYASGGFTHGPSLAGEDGTEAVISFKPSARTANLANWVRAGQMLGAGHQLNEFSPRPSGGGDNITFAPVITITGNAGKDEVEQATRQAFEEFKRMYRQMKREEARTSLAY